MKINFIINEQDINSNNDASVITFMFKKIKDSIESKVTELKENISEQVEETTTSNVKEKAEIKKDENTTVPVDKKD